MTKKKSYTENLKAFMRKHDCSNCESEALDRHSELKIKDLADICYQTGQCDMKDPFFDF